MTSYRHKSLRRQLRFELLEDRRVLTTLWVDPSVPPTPILFSSISAAVAAAHSGDTIKVVGGTYQEQVDVTKPLTLIGSQVRVAGQSGASIVAPSDPVTSMFGFKLDANHVTVKNFTIQNEMMDGIQTSGAFAGFNILRNTFFNDAVGIALSTTSASTAATTTISGNKFTSNGAGPTPQEGILSHGALANATISNNVSSTANAVAAIEIDGMSHSVNVKIQSNRITGGQGIVVANVTKAKIDGNFIGFLADGATAIHLAGAVSGSEVAGNTLIASNGSSVASFGVHLDESLIATANTTDKITGNTLTTRSGGNGTVLGFINAGIQLENSSQNTISGNFIAFARAVGIDLFRSDSNTISSNTVTQTGLGSQIGGDGIGIVLTGSNNNTLSKNVANNNVSGGILVTGLNAALATGNVLKQNAANFNYGTQASGISLGNANQNELLGNTANFNAREGIELSLADSNMLSGNTANGNLEDGIRLDISAQNTFSSNTANGNIFTGFSAFDAMSTGNAFMKNTAKNNGDGFDINSSGNMLVSNTASGNSFTGIRLLANTSNNLVKGNMIANNYGTGLVVVGSMATVSGNIVKNNHGDGIELLQLLSSSISGNIVMNNDGDGIDATSSASSNTISGNMAMGNGVAVGGFDLFDGSIGFLTAGTANTWAGNKAQTRSPAGLL